MKKLQTLACRFFLVAESALILIGCSKGEDRSTPKPTPSAATQQVQDERTALDEYVAAPDTNYSFRVVATVPGNEQTTFILEMISQAWLTTNEVDRPIWKHWMVIVKPNDVASQQFSF